jgi:hypothetical protein
MERAELHRNRSQDDKLLNQAQDMGLRAYDKMGEHFDFIRLLTSATSAREKSL